MKRSLCLLIVALTGLVACDTDPTLSFLAGDDGTLTMSSPTTTAAPIVETNEAACNYPTTVPGGDVPENLCADADTTHVTQPTAAPVIESKCGRFPLVWTSTNWNLGEGTPSPMPRCEGYAGQNLTGIALVPTSSGALGLDGQQLIFEVTDLMDGGNAAAFTLMGPDNLESVRFTARTKNLRTNGTDHSAPEHLATSFLKACADRPTVAIRGVSGCIDSAGWLVWLESGAIMHLTGPSFDDPATIAWIDGWTPAS